MPNLFISTHIKAHYNNGEHITNILDAKLQIVTKCQQTTLFVHILVGEIIAILF